MIHWYGERGVVNAIVTHLQATNAGPAFLKCIQWANQQVPDWVNNVTEVEFVVELGLANFGSPDLILVCTIRDEKQPYCVFVEAKVVQYAASAMSNQQGMKGKGFNSSINGQLALKFRFAQSLAAADVSVVSLTEPAQVHCGNLLGLADPNDLPRSLQKRTIIEKILSPHNLVGLPLNRFAYVALTRDCEPFFDQDEDILPKFFDAPGHDCYREMQSQIGWIGYQCLSDIDGLHPAFDPVLRLMVGELTPRKSLENGNSWQTLEPKPIDEMPSQLQQLTIQLMKMCRRTFGERCVKMQRGSISVSPISRVEMKIVPLQEQEQDWIYVGVRPEWPLSDWTRLETLERRFGGQSFLFVRCAANEEAVTALGSVIASLSEALKPNEPLEV